jgi:hypothetical protein
MNHLIYEHNNDYSIVYNKSLSKNNIGLMIENIHIVSQKI